MRAAHLFDDSDAPAEPARLLRRRRQRLAAPPPSRRRRRPQSVGATLFAVGVENPGFDQLVGGRRGHRGRGRRWPTIPTAWARCSRRCSRRCASSTSPPSPRRPATPAPSRSRSPSGTPPTPRSTCPGATRQGAASLEPVPVAEPSGPAFLRSPAGLAIGLGLDHPGRRRRSRSASAARSSARRQTSARRCGPTPTATSPDQEFDDDDGGDGKGQQLAQTPLLQRAVEATGSFAERRGFLTKVEAMLERANLPLRPAEALFFYAAGVVARRRCCSSRWPTARSRR